MKPFLYIVILQDSNSAHLKSVDTCVMWLTFQVNSIILILVIRTKIRSGVYRVEGGFQDVSQRNLKHSEMMR